MGLQRMGTSEAESLNALKERLAEQGFTLMDIRTTRIRSAVPALLSVRVRQSELLAFWHQFALMLEAEVSPLRALEVAAESAGNATLRKTLLEVRSRVAGGETLSRAFGLYPKVFSEATIGLLRAGEEAKSVAKAVERLLRLLEQEQFGHRRN
jgi:type IV pilus assembly protein PilC